MIFAFINLDNDEILILALNQNSFLGSNHQVVPSLLVYFPKIGSKHYEVRILTSFMQQICIPFDYPLVSIKMKSTVTRFDLSNL